MGAGPEVSIVLPTYDEAGNIVPLIRAVRGALAGASCEVLIVEDDSPDGTWRLAESEPGARVIRRVGRRGLTSALREGIAASSGRLVGFMDCDFSTPPELLPRLVAKIGEGFDVAVGSRYVPGGADARTGEPIRRLASRAIAAAARALLVPTFHD